MISLPAIVAANPLAGGGNSRRYHLDNSDSGEQMSNRSGVSWLRLFIGVTLTTLSAVALAQDLALDQPFIRVSGTGKVSVPPDLALINLGVETQAKSAEAARALAATSMTAVLDAVRAMRIEEKDLQTNWVTLYPVYAPNTANRITGYQVQNQLTVKVR